VISVKNISFDSEDHLHCLLVVLICAGVKDCNILRELLFGEGLKLVEQLLVGHGFERKLADEKKISSFGA
jgi:hypothetical protein